MECPGDIRDDALPAFTYGVQPHPHIPVPELGGGGGGRRGGGGEGREGKREGREGEVVNSLAEQAQQAKLLSGYKN